MDNNDYDGYGKHLGAALRRVLVSDGNSTTLGDFEGDNETIDDLLGNHSSEVLVGVVKGLLTDGDEADTCEMDGLSTTMMFGAALADLQAHKFVDVASGLSIAFGKVDPLVTDCKVVEEEALELANALKVLTPEAAHANFDAHHTEIL